LVPVELERAGGEGGGDGRYLDVPDTPPRSTLSMVYVDIIYCLLYYKV
jgi:hypothetical protein